MTPMPAPEITSERCALRPVLKHFRAALEEVGVKPENAEKITKRLEASGDYTGTSLA